MEQKTYFMAMLMLVATTMTIQAQNWYIRAGGGYSGEFSKTEFNNTDPNGITGIQPSTDITVSADELTMTVEALNGTVGAGYKFFATGGYMFNPYLGAEIGVNYFRGNNTTVGKLTSPQVESQAVVHIQGVDLNPGIYVTPDFQKLNPYLRAGLLLTTAGNLVIDTDVRQINGGGQGTDIVVSAQSEVKSNFSVGYSGALGVVYPINENFGIFGELEFKSFTIQSKSAEIKEFSTMAVSDGGSVPVPGKQLEDLTVSEKEFEFTDTFIQSTTEAANPNEPKKVPIQYVNASGIGLNLGVRYSF